MKTNDDGHLRDVSSRVTKTTYERWTDYVGAKEDLIAAGVATEDMFPRGRKRKKWNLGPHLAEDEKWEVERKRGGIFQLRRRHDPIALPKPPPEWNPGKFKSRTIHEASVSLGYLMDRVLGNLEKEDCGCRVHKVADRDLERLRALQYQYLDALAQARIERGEPARLRRVK